MKSPLVIIGIALIVLGVIALASQGIKYTTRENVVDVGPLKITKQTEKTIPVSPILGGLALLGGVVLLVAASRNRRS
jgi:drug/metabolite transporter (DMT)-like permease